MRSTKSPSLRLFSENISSIFITYHSITGCFLCPKDMFVRAFLHACSHAPDIISTRYNLSSGSSIEPYFLGMDMGSMENKCY
jgi:predicted metalloprotease